MAKAEALENRSPEYQTAVPVVVSIGVVTCLRAEGLARLLGSLALQKIENPELYDIRIVIVDNDLRERNRAVVDEFRGKSPVPVIFTEETQRGIPFARQKVVDTVSGDDALVFIDDDETAPPGWLNSLLKTWRETKADVVTGPVEAVLPDNAPVWAVKSGTFGTWRNYKTGTRVKKAYTNNVLIAGRVLRTVTPAFDPAFCVMGSEDIHFFQRALRQDFSIVWCREAIVRHHVPASRLTLKWLIRRSFNNGCGDTLSRIRIKKSGAAVIDVTARSIARFGYGVALAACGLLFFQYRPSIKGLRLVCAAAGTLAGLSGAYCREYDTIHGN